MQREECKDKVLSVNAGRQLEARTGAHHRISLETAFTAMDQTCLVMIDRSMWFAQTYKALKDDNSDGGEYVR